MTPARLLFLVAETGGGHLAAARAVDQALRQAFPGRFDTVLHDPLPRWFTGLYGPVVRFAPWLWGAAYHGCDSRPAVAGLLRLADRSVADAVARHQPAAIVSFHPLTGKAAARHGRPTATVVTDLVTVHTAWRCGDVDRIVLPAKAGLPVAPAFTRSAPFERAALRRQLGVPPAARPSPSRLSGYGTERQRDRAYDGRRSADDGAARSRHSRRQNPITFEEPVRGTATRNSEQTLLPPESSC